jgi:branched-chain amino acid transport system ATP-binding protein
MTALLECRDLAVSYGEAQALHGVSIEVRPKEIVALIGANGAGKTTLLRTFSGLVKPASGQIRFDGHDIAGLAPHDIVKRGLSHIPEGRGVLGTLTVKDNLRIGGYLTGTPDKDRMARLRTWFPVLFDRLAQPAAMLSGGEQQMLSIARSVLAGPKLLMVDELSLGLSPKITAELMPRLRDIRDEGASVLVVDQSIRLALKLADRIYILANGRVAWTGPAAELAAEPQLMNKYLGMD